MKVGRLKRIIAECKDDCEIIIFVASEEETSNRLKYRPFKNIKSEIINKGSSKEELHFDVSITTEYKSSHFPNNLSKEDVELLNEKRSMLLEDLKEIEEKLGDFK